MSEKSEKKRKPYKTWIIEWRCFTEYGWSDWTPTFDDDSGPYDSFEGAMRNCKSLRQQRRLKEERWEYRVSTFVRRERP